jgi:transcriptional regulator with XRE-family HTH domain
MPFGCTLHRITTIDVYCQHHRWWLFQPAAVTMAAVEPFGKVVRRVRRMKKLTLEQAANKAGISTNYLGSIELGQRDPSMSTVTAIARALGVSAGDLLGGPDSLSAPALEMARMFAGLDDEHQDALLRLVRALPQRRAPGVRGRR